MLSYPITRRGFLRGLGVTALAGLGGRLVAAEERRPNFLFLFTDDQTFASIHALNNPDIITPNLDRLAARSVVFTHCFNQGSWSGAVCICSRAMLNTGQFLYHAQTGINTSPLWGETLAQAGYAAHLIGKWHNGVPSALRGFTSGTSVGAGMYEARDSYDRPGKDEPYGEWASDPTKGGHWQPRVWDIVVDAEGKRTAAKPYRVEQHTSELYADKAIEFLRETVPKSDDPFLLYVAFNAPHDPRQSPRAFLDLYDPAKLRVPPNFLPEHPFDQGDHRIRDEKLAPFPRTERAVQVHRAEYYSIISHFDAQIGRILAALEASGQVANTYVILSSDHGLAVGQHGLMGKQNQYDHSIRMPLLIAGPGLASRRVDRLVYLHSLFATTCELAGMPVPNTVEFPSLAPLLRGEDVVLHDAVFGSYRHFQRMVRTERWKLIVYPMIQRVQFFDLDADPDECHDLSGDPAQAERIAALRARLRALQAEVGDTLDLDHPQAPVPVTNVGEPVIPDGDGVFHLTPRAAHTTGHLVYQADRNNLGAWVDPADTPSWQLQRVPAGSYRVRFAYGCTQPGTPFAIEIGSQRVEGRTEDTGGLKTYRWFELGVVEVPPGEVLVRVRPGPFRSVFANLRGIELLPVR